MYTYLERTTLLALQIWPQKKLVQIDMKDIIHPSVVTSIDQNFSKNSFLKSENSEQHLPRIKKALVQYLKDLDLDFKNLCQIIKIF